MGILDSRLSSLESFFSGLWRLSFLGVVGNGHSQPPCHGVQSTPDSLPHLLWVDM